VLIDKKNFDIDLIDGSLKLLVHPPALQAIRVGKEMVAL
jgi:hypothetical protein